MKYIISISSVILFTCLVLSCGDGTISPSGVEDDMALLNYGEFNPDGMINLVNDAIANCQDDPSCASAMEKANGTIEIDSVISSSSVEQDTVKTEQPKSSALIVVRSSSSVTPVITPIGGSSSSVETSSGSTIVTSSTTVTNLDVPAIDGSCAVGSAIDKGTNGTATFTKKSLTMPSGVNLMDWSKVLTAYNTKFKEATCTWKVDGETVSSAACGTGTLSYKYTASGPHKVSVVIEEKEYDCGTQQVNGAKITSCKCLPSETKPDVVSGPVEVTWSVSSCVTDANITEYEWDEIDGSNETGSYTFTEKNEEVTPIVSVSNDDGTKQDFTCTTVKALDSSKPDYEIVKGETLSVPSGECGVATVAGNIRFEHGYDGVNCDVTLTINGTVYKNTVSYCNIYYGVLSCDGISVTAGTSICLEMTGKDGILKMKYQ